MPRPTPVGAQRLPALEHAEQRLARALVESQEPDELGEDLVLRSRAKVERDRVGTEEIRELHGGGNLHPPDGSVKAGAGASAAEAAHPARHSSRLPESLPLAVRDVEQVAAHEHTERRAPRSSGCSRSSTSDPIRLSPLRIEGEPKNAVRLDSILNSDELSSIEVQAVDAERQHSLPARQQHHPSRGRSIFNMPRE